MIAAPLLAGLSVTKTHGFNVLFEERLSVAGDGIATGGVSFLPTLAPIFCQGPRKPMIPTPTLILTDGFQSEGSDVGIEIGIGPRLGAAVPWS